MILQVYPGKVTEKMSLMTIVLLVVVFSLSAGQVPSRREYIITRILHFLTSCSPIRFWLVVKVTHHDADML